MTKKESLMVFAALIRYQSVVNVIKAPITDEEWNPWYKAVEIMEREILGEENE